MTYHEKLDKVINGLTCHVHGDPHTRCHKCPYWGTGPHGLSQCSLLFADALDILNIMLKAQEPRAMSLEEVREKKPFCLWVEDLDTGALVFPVAYIDGEYQDRTLDWCVCIDLEAASEDYGVRWRFWTSRPTDEQRQAVKLDA